MARLPRLLVTALLAVAVPFQGALAVNAAQCMALQHHEGSAGQEAQATHEGHEHSHPQAPQSEPDHGKGAGSHCGPCTGCCASAAIAAPLRIDVSLAAHDAINALPVIRPLGDLPDGLDRPPLAL